MLLRFIHLLNPLPNLLHRHHFNHFKTQPPYLLNNRLFYPHLYHSLNPQVVQQINLLPHPLCLPPRSHRHHLLANPTVNPLICHLHSQTDHHPTHPPTIRTTNHPQHHLSHQRFNLTGSQHAYLRAFLPCNLISILLDHLPGSHLFSHLINHPCHHRINL